jgi:hypothetical protein
LRPHAHAIAVDLPGTIAGHTALPKRRAASIESNVLFLRDFADALELDRIPVAAILLERTRFFAASTAYEPSSAITEGSRCSTVCRRRGGVVLAKAAVAGFRQERFAISSEP